MLQWKWYYFSGHSSRTDADSDDEQSDADENNLDSLVDGKTLEEVLVQKNIFPLIYSTHYIISYVYYW